jgi:2-hydroxychromene-2-carboxylate isomerase
MPVQIDVYYDFRSPYAYFAWWRIRHGFLPSATWRWRPISVDVLLNLQAGRAPRAAYVDPLALPKRRHFLLDIRRSADFYGAPLVPPNTPRPDPSPALCAALLLERSVRSHDGFIDAVFEAMWQRSRDIGALEVLKDCLEQASLDASLADQAFSGELRDALVGRTTSAYQAGIFGVPTFVANSEIFFGADRMDMLAWRLRQTAA